MPTPTFTFEVTANDEDQTKTTFTVESFTGEERISKPFEYRLTLRHGNPNLDYGKIVNQGAVLTMEQAPHADPTVMTTVPVEGIVAGFRITRQFDNDDVECEAVLVPKLWRLGMTRGSKVFQSCTTRQIVEMVLCTELVSDDFLFCLSESYPVREFCMQYQESNLDFIQRLLEHEGIYYYYRDGRLIFSDARAFEVGVDGMRQVTFGEATGAMTPADDQVYRFVYNEQIVPQKVEVQDYDFEAFASEKEVEQNTDVASSGGEYARVGTHKEHGRFAVEDRSWTGKESDDSDTTDAAQTSSDSRDTQLARIALVRAQEHEARRLTVDALSTASRIQAGRVFELAGHFRFDGDYLVTGVRHTYDGTDYTNAFTCLPAAVQFRPPRRTPVPRVPGIMTAKVKGGTADGAAYIDEEGRYRLRFPFDPNAATASEPSRPIRLAQPYAGPDYGIHFPNRADAEMVFACLDGDPDRPLGLGTVPNPWTHTPAPSTANELRSQNPWTGALSGDETKFDHHKNVIRTALGHQLVMDDHNGGSNVGVTLQTGSKDNSVGQDVYWKTRLEMGGYRVKSGVEQVIDGATEAAAWLGVILARSVPDLASQLLTVGASTVEAGNYGEDTFGNTTPVGIHMKTDQSVDVKGHKGVNIVSPNLFGLFSGNFVGDDKTQKEAQHVVESVSKALLNVIWRDLMNTYLDERDEYKKAVAKSEANRSSDPKKKAFFKWKKGVKEQRISDALFTLLQRSGVNVSSAGELKLASLQSTSITAAQGGIALNSFGHIEQKADLGVELTSHEGITIKTKGKVYEGGNKLKKKFDDVAGGVRNLFPMFVSLIGKAFGKEGAGDQLMIDKDETFPIAIENEKGDITIRTGGEDQEGEGDILISADGAGRVLMFAEEELVHLSADEETGILLDVGARAFLPTDKKLEPIDDDEVYGRLAINDKQLEGYNDTKCHFHVGDDASSADNPHVTVERKKIELKCGDSSLILKEDGTITLKGKKISVLAQEKGGGDVELGGNNIDVFAQQEANIEGGASVNLKGQMSNLEGQMLKIKGQMAQIEGSLIKVG